MMTRWTSSRHFLLRWWQCQKKTAAKMELWNLNEALTFLFLFLNKIKFKKQKQSRDSTGQQKNKKLLANGNLKNWNKSVKRRASERTRPATSRNEVWTVIATDEADAAGLHSTPLQSRCTHTNRDTPERNIEEEERKKETFLSLSLSAYAHTRQWVVVFRFGAVLCCAVERKRGWSDPRRCKSVFSLSLSLAASSTRLSSCAASCL